MTIYVHPFTVRYYDYDTRLPGRRGIKLSYDGESPIGGTFKEGATVEGELRRLTAIAAKHPEGGITIVKGKPLASSVNLNPRGLI